MLRRILVPTDGTDGSEHAAEWAMELAADEEADVVGLWVNNVSDIIPATTSPEPPEEVSSAVEREGSEALSRLEAMAPEGVSVTTEFREGNPANEIVTFARENDVDAVVMARKGTSLLANLGSNTSDVVRASSVPIIVVPTDEKAAD
jgi:nucleotide-binding universal stress UspA family protein